MSPSEVSVGEVGAAAEAMAATLTGAAVTLARLDPALDVLAAVPGRLGDLGQALHTELVAALGARAREAAAHAARFADAVQLLRVVRAGYADVDAQARQRHREGEP